ncbi:MAG: threonylcarbamoyl-AMP synthase [Nanoarchaeota archaeon]|nr:threonylcarbamoyl-AMP synthase [Nanoarchaeota archaeon]MBU4124576.1 threonylcarbamoyl-AMP synthase [Nanoarchaeota archaeon]
MLLKYSKKKEPIIIKESVRILKKGGLIVYPTDTVYGIGADATKRKSIEKIYKIKKRSKKVFISALVSNKKMLKEYSFPSKLAIRKFPGKYTFILKSKKNLPIAKDYIGFRIPNHWCVKIAKQFGKPITTTSANVSGQPTPNNIQDIQKMFGKSIDLYIDDGKLSGKPSKIFSKDNKRIR